MRRTKNPLRGAAAICQAVGAVIGRRKMAKHFALTITEDSCHVARKSEAVADEARLDGIYVLRTSLPAKHTDTAAAPQG